MDQWRSYFQNAGADIWTVIKQAIILAATDFPMDFPEKRGCIAETLFSKQLIQGQVCEPRNSSLHVSVPNFGGLMSACVPQTRDESNASLQSTQMPRNNVEGLCKSDGDERGLVDDNLHLLKYLNFIKDVIADTAQSENEIMNALGKLECMQISLKTLKATEIGKHVYELRKHSSKRVRTLSKQLVRNWRGMIDKWAKSVDDATKTVMKAPSSCITEEADIVRVGSLLPSTNGCVLISTRTTPLEMPQLSNRLNDMPCMHLDNDKPVNGFRSFDKSNLESNLLEHSSIAFEARLASGHSNYSKSVDRLGMMHGLGEASNDKASMDHSGRLTNGHYNPVETVDGSAFMHASQITGYNNPQSAGVNGLPKPRSLSQGPGRTTTKGQTENAVERGLSPGPGRPTNKDQAENTVDVHKRKIADLCQQARNAKLRAFSQQPVWCSGAREDASACSFPK